MRPSAGVKEDSWPCSPSDSELTSSYSTGALCRVPTFLSRFLRSLCLFFLSLWCRAPRGTAGTSPSSIRPIVASSGLRFLLPCRSFLRFPDDSRGLWRCPDTEEAAEDEVDRAGAGGWLREEPPGIGGHRGENMPSLCPPESPSQ